jgi:predicted secreted hydrolase
MSNQRKTMKRAAPWAAFGIGLAGVCVLLGVLLFRPSADKQQIRLIGMSEGSSDALFARVEGPLALEFPRDHGPHPSYQTEWWYYTGNLTAQDGRRFGYQLTFFRRSLQPVSQWQERASDWATNQVYMGHFTLSDVSGQKFRYFERFERGAAGLAGAQADPTFQVWLDDWSVEQVGIDQYRIRASVEDIALDLLIKDRKGPILQGDRGYSRKGPEPDAPGKPGFAGGWR